MARSRGEFAPRIRFCTFGFATWLVGCTITTEPDLPAFRTFDDDALDAVTEETCKAGRYVAKLKLEYAHRDCPFDSASAWSTYKLFDRHTSRLVEDTGSLSTELARYCVYVPRIPGTPLPPSALFEDVGPDCDVVTPEAIGPRPRVPGPISVPIPVPVPDPLPFSTDALTFALADSFRTAFDAVAGRIPSTTLAQLWQSQTTSPVRVYVIDTMPHDWPTYPTSDHGESMAQLVADLTGADLPDASIEVETVLALPRVLGVLNEVHGGYNGSQADLAAGIYEAYVRWQDAPGNSRAIFNLSVGFDPAFTDPGPAEEAALAAIQTARCSGALVFAAVGNEVHACATGPLYPAAWEDVPAGCPASSGPLVYAVTGVGFDGASLMPNRRTASVVGLAAAASNVVIPETVDPIVVKTGTSVATAVTSAAAAIAWSIDDQARGSEIVDILYQHGSAIGATAQFGTRVGDDAHRITLCGAMDGAWGNQAHPDWWYTCPIVDSSANWTLVREGLEGVEPAFVKPQRLADLECSDGSATMTDECSAAVKLYYPNGQDPKSVYEPLQVRPVERFTLPQPTSIPCPACVRNGSLVTASRVAEYATYTIDTIKVDLTGQFGTNYSYIEVNDTILTALNGGSTVQFSLPTNIMSQVNNTSATNVIFNFEEFQRVSTTLVF